MEWERRLRGRELKVVIRGVNSGGRGDGIEWDVRVRGNS